MDNHRITVGKVANDIGISIGSNSMRFFFDVLGMKCAITKFVPKLLNFKQKQRPVQITKRSKRLPELSKHIIASKKLASLRIRYRK